MARPRKPRTTGPKVGDKVWFNMGGSERLAEIVGDKDEAGKYEVFIPEGSVVRSTYREPSDYGPEGGGDTFRKR